MSSPNERLLVTSRTDFTPEKWNSVFREVGQRLSDVEAVKPTVEQLIEETRAQAVARVNLALAQVVTMITGVANVGALLTVNATGEVTIGPGEKTLFVTQSQRHIMTNSGIAVARPAGDPDARITGVITGYSEETGELRFVVSDSRGVGLTATDWVVSYAKTVIEGPPGPWAEHRIVGNDVQWRNPDGSWGDLLNIGGDPELIGLLAASQIASQAEALAGLLNTKAMTPLRNKQVLDAFVADTLPGLVVQHTPVDKDLELAVLLSSITGETGQSGSFFADGFGDTADIDVANLVADQLVYDAVNKRFVATEILYDANLIAAATLSASPSPSTGTTDNLKDTLLGTAAGTGISYGSGTSFTVNADLGAAKSVRAIALTTNTQYRPRDFVLSGSPDNATWTPVLSVTNYAPYDPQGATVTPYVLPAAHSYRYWRLAVTLGSGGSTVYLNTLHLYEAVAAGASVLKSLAIPLLAVPVKATGVLQFGGGAIGATTFELSRNNGANWTSCPLTSIGTQGGTALYKFEDVSLAGQPSGSTLKWRATLPVGRWLSGVALRTKAT